MPAFNAERTIAGAINSIISQTYKNWELIIVNDGSTDNTFNECAKFDDERITVWTISHQGLVYARNFGNSKAKGEYCIVQDADDYSLPDRLEKVMNLFENSDVDWDVIIHGAYINTWDNQYQCMRRIYVEPNLDVLHNKVPGWPAYKKSIWEAKPFRMETQYSYDWMMHLDWMLSGYKYCKLNEGLYEYVRYSGSASDRFEKSGLRKEAFKKIKQIVKDEYSVEART